MCSVTTTVTCQVISHPHLMALYSSQVVDKRMQGFGQWMNSSIVHDNVYPLVHKKCHPKSYHSDIKYRMTLNIMLSVVRLSTGVP